MEDPYGELPNYEVVNALQELRDENKELKVKIEEHSVAMEKLQKGYDILDMEFKTLQYHYTSLLMSARSEFQKKVERINQLNAEKEMMVMNAIKNGKQMRRHGNQCVKHPGRLNYDRASAGGGKKNKEDVVKEDIVKEENGNNKN